jgi:hypothetical protein
MSGSHSRSMLAASNQQLIRLALLLLLSLAASLEFADSAAAVTPTVTTGSATKLTANSAELHGTVNPNGSATEYFFEYGKTAEYGSFKPLPAVEVGSGTKAVEVSVVVEGLRPGTAYHFRLTAINAFGFASGSDATLETPPVYSSSFGSFGVGEAQFVSPQDVAVDGSGNLYIANQVSGSPKIKKFNSKGEYLSQFGSGGTGNGQFQSIKGLAVAAGGEIWVSADKRIQKFNAKGEYLSQFSPSGAPFGITIDSKGNLWVCVQSGLIEEFNSEGKWIRTVGSEGTGKGQFLECDGIDIGPGGTVWATDGEANKVNVYNESGTFLFEFGSTGSGKGQFSKPVGIEVDAQGHVWVGEGGNDRVQEFNQSGEYVTQFGSLGSGAGQLNLGSFFGLASDGEGNLWITDTGNSRIEKWSF